MGGKGGEARCQHFSLSERGKKYTSLVRRPEESGVGTGGKGRAGTSSLSKRGKKKEDPLLLCLEIRGGNRIRGDLFRINLSPGEKKEGGESR